MLRWLDARLLGDAQTFPVYRSTDGDAAVYRDPTRKTMEFVVASFLENAPAVKVFERERFRVAVLRGNDSCDGCGRPLFWLDAQFREPEHDEWRPLLMLPESKLPVVQSVLDDIARFLASSEARAGATAEK